MIIVDPPPNVGAPSPPPVLPPKRAAPGGSSEDSGVDSGTISRASDRSRRQSPLAVELRCLDAALAARPSGEDKEKGAGGDTPPPSSSAPSPPFADASYAESDEMMYFEPKLGLFGAPVCRWTSSVMALIGMMSGAVFATSGACILVFFVAEEPTVWPLGVTLGVVGSALMALGAIMWTSEFLCNDCLGRAHQKLKEAPLKSALKRRSRMTLRAGSSTSSTAHMVAGSRAGSRLSDLSFRTGGANRAVSTRY